VILDVMMPSIDGYMVLNVIKDDACLQDTPVIVISALEDSRSMARCIELGAEDYLPREFEPVILKARIDACLEKRRIKVQRESAIRAIMESQKLLRSELRGAADYVSSLLPAPLDSGTVEADWQFIPSQSLGGDIFNYAFLEEHLFSFYLIDVSGHGIEAALVSVTIMNMLKSQSLAGADYRDPASVLRALNEAFRSEDQNNLYFTIWYGVYDDRTRELTFSSGGAVPAVLTGAAGSFELLSTEGMVIGVDQGAVYDSRTVKIAPDGIVCLFSDGIFEISTDTSRILGLHDFADLVAKTACTGCDMGTMLRNLVTRVRGLSTSGMFEDDVSLFAFRFKEGGS
jgi:phosphoserine phosphatase RsbU/P